MNQSLKKEVTKNARLVSRLNGYMSKINQVLTEISPTASAPRKSRVSQTERVLAVIESAGKKGVTSDEILKALPGVPYGSITSRYGILKNSGHIKIDGRTRSGTSGRQQRVMWSKKNYTTA